MSKKVFSVIMFPLLLTSCSSPISERDSISRSKNSLVITDSNDREVEIDLENTKRVICIGAGALRLYSYVGNLDLLVGVEDIDRDINTLSVNPFLNASRPYYDAYKYIFKKLDSCGKGGPQNQSPDYEKILECNPDLIISEYTSPDVVKNIEEKTNKKVVCISYGSNSVFDDNVKKSLTNISLICQNNKAEELIKYIEDCEKELKSIGEANYNENNTFYVGCLGNWGKQSLLSTSTNYPLFNVNKVKNVFDINFELESGKTTLEALMNANPKYMILDSAGIDLFEQEYKGDTSFRIGVSQIDAYKNQKIYLQMPYNAYYTNLEIALMDAYYISYIAYPSAYDKNFSIANKSNEIIKKFLAVDRFYDRVCSAISSKGGFQNLGNLGDKWNM